MFRIAFVISLFVLATTSSYGYQLWQCSAEGKTHLNEDFVAVAGWPASTKEKAEKEALMACTAAGLFSCSVLDCEQIKP